MVYHLNAKPFHIITVLIKFGYNSHSRWTVLSANAIRQFIQSFTACQTCDFTYKGRINFFASACALVKNRKSVTQCTVCNTGNKNCRIIIKLHTLKLCNLLQPDWHSFRLNTLKIKSLTAWQNCCRKLMHLGSGKNKYYMSRRFFKSFKKSIKCTGRKHMNLVNNINSVFTPARCIISFFS